MDCSEYDEDYGGAELRVVSDPNSSGLRVLRGGSWDDKPERLRSAARIWIAPRLRYYYAGFHLAITLSI